MYKRVPTCTSFGCPEKTHTLDLTIFGQRLSETSSFCVNVAECLKRLLLTLLSLGRFIFHPPPLLLLIDAFQQAAKCKGKTKLTSLVTSSLLQQQHHLLPSPFLLFVSLRLILNIGNRFIRNHSMLSGSFAHTYGIFTSLTVFDTAFFSRT